MSPVVRGDDVRPSRRRDSVGRGSDVLREGDGCGEPDVDREVRRRNAVRGSGTGSRTGDWDVAGRRGVVRSSV